MLIILFSTYFSVDSGLEKLIEDAYNKIEGDLTILSKVDPALVKVKLDSPSCTHDNKKTNEITCHNVTVDHVHEIKAEIEIDPKACDHKSDIMLTMYVPGQTGSTMKLKISKY